MVAERVILKILECPNEREFLDAVRADTPVVMKTKGEEGVTKCLQLYIEGPTHREGVGEHGEILRTFCFLGHTVKAEEVIGEVTPGTREEEKGELILSKRPKSRQVR